MSAERPIPHGTYSGYQRCRSRPEKACADCRDAMARYMRGYRLPRLLTSNGDADLFTRRPDLLAMSAAGARAAAAVREGA